MLSGCRIKKRKRKRLHGFLRRQKSGSIILKRRRKGRKKLST